MRFPKPPLGNVDWFGMMRSYESRLISGWVSSTRVMMYDSAVRTIRALVFSAKKNQMCAPFPERDLSKATGSSSSRTFLTTAKASRRQDDSSKSMTANVTVSSFAIGYAPISNGFCLPSFPRKCHLMTSSETGIIFLLGHSAHFSPRSRPQTPRTHWFSQQGEYPFLPVLALSKRRANTSPRPQNSERNSFTFSSLDELLSTPLMVVFVKIPLSNQDFL